MEGAVVVLFVPAVMLVAGGVLLAVWGARSPSPPRAVGVLRMIAGAGMLGAAVVAFGGLYMDTPDGLIVYPILGVIVGVVWIVPWIAVAAVLSSRARRRAWN